MYLLFMGVDENFKIIDIMKAQREINRLKSRFLKQKCKICKGMLCQNGLSEMPGICKQCGERIYG